jgi:hypothetical protein
MDENNRKEMIVSIKLRYIVDMTVEKCDIR